ncbi:MAG: hypothetical protein ACRYHQ_12085 [Janthinobacterium lividum]
MTRRDLLGHGAARAAVAPAEPPFDSSAFGTVGVFGLDWLLDLRFIRLLDTLAASPGAVRGVRGAQPGAGQGVPHDQRRRVERPGRGAGLQPHLAGAGCTGTARPGAIPTADLLPARGVPPR